MCSQCNNPYHPATGHVFSAHTVMCGPCCRRFFAWVKEHTNKRAPKRSGKCSVSFYEAAMSSVKAF
jgi:hypothetical protein